MYRAKFQNDLRLRIFLILIIVFRIQLVLATTYYVDSRLGNDAFDGRSGSMPLKTIDKLNTLSLVGGDIVLFKRGETYRGTLVPRSGTTAQSVTYGAYGSVNLPKPKLLASYQRNSTSDWVNEGSNIWATGDKLSISPVETLGTDVGNLILGNETDCGIKVWNKTDLNLEGEFWYDATSSKVYLFSTHGNPASFYQNIEVVTARANVNGTARSYLIFENLDFRYGNGIGFQGYGTGTSYVYPKNIIIRDVDVSFIGGAKLSGTTRAGNGIGFWNGAKDVLIERCRISQCYDSGISPQGDLDGHICQNLTFRNNIIDNCEQSFEMWQRGTSTLSNINFDNNTCTNAGFGWSHNQRPDPNGVHLLFWGFASTVNISNINIRNNIFMNVKDYGIYSHWADDINKVNIDYNCWFTQSSSVLLRFSYPLNSATKNAASYSWSTYRTFFSDDSHSKNINPELNSDLTLGSNSPCKDAGQSISPVYSDFRQLLRPQGSGFDIGAYEYEMSNEIKDLRATINCSVTVYPNPATKYINVRIDNESAESIQLSLISWDGKVIVSESVAKSPSGDYILNINQKPNSGSYLLKVVQGKFSKTLTVMIF